MVTYCALLTQKTVISLSDISFHLLRTDHLKRKMTLWPRRILCFVPELQESYSWWKSALSLREQHLCRQSPKRRYKETFSSTFPMQMVLETFIGNITTDIGRRPCLSTPLAVSGCIFRIWMIDDPLRLSKVIDADRLQSNAKDRTWRRKHWSCKWRLTFLWCTAYRQRLLGRKSTVQQYRFSTGK